MRGRVEENVVGAPRRAGSHTAITWPIFPSLSA